MNRLYYGDCLTILQGFKLASVDLIYLDPPFNSNRQYNAIYRDETGRPLPDQVEAFCDTWELTPERERAVRYVPVLMRENGIDDEIAEFWRLWLRALRHTQPRLLAYLTYMAERLLVMHRILKPTGSLYLHCDPTASHYVKALLDAIFGHGNFRNEIVWKRTGAHGGARRWGPIHDTLLFYSKSDHYTWNRTYQAYDPQYVDRFFRYSDDRGRYRVTILTGPGVRHGDSGQPWRDVDPTASGRHWAVPQGATLHWSFRRPDVWDSLTVQERLDALDQAGFIHWPERGSVPSFKQYLEASPGNPVQDIIWDISPALGREAMGYATQKPRALLERIITASSNEDDVVLDPFCGCATTLEAAHSLKRRWIGIDIAIHAVKRVASVRLKERIGLIEGEDFTVEGVPRDVEGARDLWERDKYHFQKWAVEQVDGFVTAKRTADGGIDGRLYFAMPTSELESMVLEVKGGRTVSIRDLRALQGVLDNGDALLAGLIVLNDLGPTQARNFARFAASAGTLDVLGIDYPRLQVLTVGEILDGRRFKTPSVVGRHEPQARLPGLPSA